MDVTAALAADLALLTQALDDPATDLAQTLQRFVADARLAVPSYLGLRVAFTDSDGDSLKFTLLLDGVTPSDVAASVHLALPPGADGDTAAAPSSVSLILYASTPGAFVDLAADLSWMTGRHLTDFGLDRHLNTTIEPNRTLDATSTINQAIGVLIGRGLTHANAHSELDAQAGLAGTNRHEAAHNLLATLTNPRAND